jgi:hypothetical protein
MKSLIGCGSNYMASLRPSCTRPGWAALKMTTPSAVQGLVREGLLVV